MSVEAVSSLRTASLPLVDISRENLPAYVLEQIPELALQIFSHLSMHDLLKLSQVSKNIRLLSEENSLWKKIFNIKLPEKENSIKKFIYDNYIQKYEKDHRLSSKSRVIELLQKVLNTMDRNTQLEFECKYPFTNLNKEASIKIGLYPKNATNIKFIECILLDKIDSCAESNFNHVMDDCFSSWGITFSLIREYSSEHQGFYHDISTLLSNKLNSITAKRHARINKIMGIWMVTALILILMTNGQFIRTRTSIV